LLTGPGSLLAVRENDWEEKVTPGEEKKKKRYRGPDMSRGNRKGFGYIRGGMA